MNPPRNCCTFQSHERVRIEKRTNLLFTIFIKASAMNVETISIFLGVFWTISFVIISGVYFLVMLHAWTLTEKKSSVLFGCWFLEPKIFPTEEGKRCCKLGAILFLLQLLLMGVRFFYWGNVIHCISNFVS